MSATKKLLQTRKSEILKQLEPLYKLEKELAEINMALEAIEGPQCNGCSDGCDICRTGPNYR